jgi:hypothetical protein
MIRYNKEVRDYEAYEGVARGWVSQDYSRNFGGHNLFVTSSIGSFSTGQRLDINASAVRDPFGGSNTYYATENTTSNTTHSIYLQRTGNGGTPHTFSVFAKADANNRDIGIYADGITNGIGYVSFNLTTGAATVLTSQSGLLSYGSKAYGNGWWRVWITGSTAGTGTYYFHIDTVSGGTSTFVGTVGAGLYLFGPQMEQASTPGPYTVTAGAAAPIPQTIGNYRVHTFTTTGTSGFTPAVSGCVEVLVVAGGGAGGQGYGGGAGGGGGGGIIHRENFFVTADTPQTVVVGAGGAAVNSNIPGTSGGNSQFGNLIAIGGGGGVSQNYATAGGSGGGGGEVSGYQVPGAGTLGQGFQGGYGISSGNNGGAGGGGAGGHGQASAAVLVGQGGMGQYFPQFSHAGYPAGWFGGGGGASQNSSSIGSQGGLGGGGFGGAGSGGSGTPSSGVANTGGGGGGTYTTSAGTLTGGSGIVIVRYRYD